MYILSITPTVYAWEKNLHGNYKIWWYTCTWFSVYIKVGQADSGRSFDSWMMCSFAVMLHYKLKHRLHYRLEVMENSNLHDNDDDELGLFEEKKKTKENMTDIIITHKLSWNGNKGLFILYS